MLDSFLEKHPNADAKRVFVGGFSMGGIMSWLVAGEHPERLAGILPCCGTCSYDTFRDELERMKYLPIWAIISNGDSKQAVKELGIYMPGMIETAASKGNESRLTILPKAYNMPDGKTPIPHAHCVWLPVLNDFKYDSGKLYVDKDGKPVPSTIIEWFNSIGNE
jgi:predicted peptidase